MRRVIVLALLLVSAKSRAENGWATVEKTMGRPGMEQREGFQILFPRTDLNVVVQGFPLDSANVLVSQFLFQPGPEGKPKKAQMEGRVYLLDSEVPQAMAQALRGGLEITALYSPFLEESPALKCLRLRGEGSRSSLAWAAQMVLSPTGTPMDAPAKNPAPAGSPTALVTPSTNKDAWEDIQGVLGQGEEKGLTLLYKWDGQGKDASLAFQNHGKDITAFGEFSIPEEKSKALVEEFLQRHITVTSRFTEDSAESPRSFVDFWAVGDGKKLAEDLKEILAQLNMGDLNE
jgi:hypothetical protein